MMKNMKPCTLDYGKSRALSFLVFTTRWIQRSQGYQNQMTPKERIFGVPQEQAV